MVEDSDRDTAGQLTNWGGAPCLSLLMAWDRRCALLTVVITAFSRAVSEVRRGIDR